MFDGQCSGQMIFFHMYCFALF